MSKKAEDLGTVRELMEGIEASREEAKKPRKGRPKKSGIRFAKSFEAGPDRDDLKVPSPGWRHG